MIRSVRQLRICIGSPGDCNAERDAVRRLTQEDPAIRALCRRQNVSLDVLGWEDVPPDAGRPQSLINAAVERFDPDWFVFLFWHRFGSEAGLGMTGTEEEWNRARRANHQGEGRPAISIYFNRADPPMDALDAAQFSSVQAFRGTVFAERQALAEDFYGTDDFCEVFRAHLTEKILDLGVSGEVPGPDLVDIRQEFANASRGLLSWPRGLGDGERIERPECELLASKILGSDRSTTLMLGGRGLGKSALLAELGLRLAERGVTLLAIKADMVAATVSDNEGLREWLNLSLDPREAVGALASEEKVVVLVDQLDAVSTLLDQRSERLNVLLNLIQTLSGTPGVHLVASCREFEFRHDVRLSSLDVERLDLEPPIWEEVAPILSRHGHDPDSMGEPLRELLRVPIQLKVYLEVAEPSMRFGSLSALLEALWEQRVVDAQGPPNRHTLLAQLAERMADEETLWLPVSATDDYAEARTALEQAEILIRDPRNLSIGFRHQTYFDHTLARAFASGSISLADHILSRQDGLFVRPTLLSGLQYLRSTSEAEYHSQLRTLMGAGVRLHVRSLLIEFLGEWEDPDDEEASLLLPLLDSVNEGPRVLTAVAGSPGWFARLRVHTGLERWLREDPDTASYCAPLLSAAMRFAREAALDLMETHWSANQAYDNLCLGVLLDLDRWNARAINLVRKLVRRTEWLLVENLAEKAAGSAPDLAPRIVRADLDRRLEETLRQVNEKTSEPPSDTDEEELMYQALVNRPTAPFEQLIENDRDWHDLSGIARAAPTAFVDEVWPWVRDVVSQLAYKPDTLTSYRDDFATDSGFGGNLRPSPVVGALLVAILELANVHRQTFWDFVTDNLDSEFLVTHRFMARGLELVAAQEPSRVLNYLLGDPRRMVIGGSEDNHSETKRLISALCPHLSSDDQKRLEEAVVAFKAYPQLPSGESAEERFRHLKWNRRHRLRLLRAFPEGCLGSEGRRLMEQEERALPSTSDRDSGIYGGWVGPRLRLDEMERASDEDLLRLFDEMPDETEWSGPRRDYWMKEDSSRAGGAIQLSRQFGDLAKSAPERVARLLPALQSGRHEMYAGAALESLAETELPTTELVGLIEDLDDRGFASGNFREGAAAACEKRAVRDKGLPETVLARLNTWLETHPEPTWDPEEEEEKERSEREGRPVLFGLGGSFVQPPGRGYIIRAIGAGYSAQEPPAVEAWTRVIEERLEQERHPGVWVETLMNMPVLFRGDFDRATALYNAVISNNPSILEQAFVLRLLTNTLGAFRPRERVQEWLGVLFSRNTTFCRQAYGELLFLYYCHHKDEWSKQRISEQLADTSDVAALRGLAYAASYLWGQVPCRPAAARVLRELASCQDQSVQEAVARVFFSIDGGFDLDSHMRGIIEAARGNPELLLRAAPDLLETLAPLTGTEPEIVSRVCGDIVRYGGEQIGDIRSSLTRVAGDLTNVALTLHRQTNYRTEGLDLFEELISRNVREARLALNTLDRRPFHR